MRSFLSGWALIVFFLTGIESKAQIRDIQFNLFTGSNGITLGKINSMTRDKYGYLWFSDQSNRCILRYDGSHITRYQNDPRNPNSLGGYYPECLFADTGGNIWIGFYGMGFDKFDPVANKFTHYRHSDKDPEGLSNDFVCAILIDHLGNIWIGNYGGLDLLDEKTGKFKHYRRKMNDTISLSCDSVRAIYEDKAGELWIGTGFAFDDLNHNGGLNHFNRSNGTFVRYMHDPKNPQSLASNKVRSILEDSYGNFWIGSDGDGLHTLDRKTGLFTRYSYDPKMPDKLSRSSLQGIWDHITFITEDADRKIWIGTLQNGVIHYDPVSKQVTRYGNVDDKPGLLKDNTSWFAIATPDGFVWMSTQNANLLKIDIYNTTIAFFGNRARTYDMNFGVPNGVYSFHEENDSVLWLGTDSGLVRKDLITANNRNFRYNRSDPNSLSNNSVLELLKDKKGNFWIGTKSGLNLFDPKTGKFIRYYPDPINKTSASNYIIKLCEDSYSNIWIGTYGGGLFMLDPALTKFYKYKNNPADTSTLSGDNVTCLLEDNGGLWIGHDLFSGLDSMNLQTKKFTHYLPGLIISSIYKDAKGLIWAGTPIGLFIYDKKSDNFHPFNDNTVLSDIVQISAITGDKEDNLWLSTESGIYMLNKNRDHINHYGKDFGIAESNNHFFYSSYLTTKSGKLYFGNVQGYYMFSPDKLKVNSTNTQLYFTGFWLGNKKIAPSKDVPLRQSLYDAKEISLNHDQNVFSFSSTFIDFRNAAEKRIYYKLENYDADWRNAGPEDIVTYFKVPPGKYIFKIKTSNSRNDEWIEKGIAISILPPWWMRWWAYCIYGLVLVSLGVILHRYQKRKVIQAERERTKAMELAQAKEIEKAYHELRNTQAQLIQSEKMASLGELTAGIAHEIQNPLNFVNNFSDVNKEMLMELNEEIDKGNYHDAKAIAKDIINNEEKINHHGRRADAIVKGMLQHSRSSTGVKELTDINKLTDEYLRLAYHGLRAKEKDFNVGFKTDFDESIGKITMVPQEFGRVLLNLINNAFYAVNEKRKTSGASYEPTVKVSTKRSENQVSISVRDNGNGIPKNIVDKIFQPFFTTKPTGQGTGLGLSLSYDIVKAHGGEIRVETNPGEGTIFIIQLPV